MVGFLDRRWLAAFAGLACVVAAFALMSGPSRAAAKKGCSGSPVGFSVVTDLSNNAAGLQVSPEVVSGFRAAAAAITKSCELGRPLKIIACDDKGSPNGAASCGRDAVAAKVLGVAAYTGFGDSYSPPVLAAQIPILPITASSASESSSKLSYPFGDPVPVVLSTLPAAKAAGAKRIALLHLDLPSIGFFINLVKKQAGRFGMQVSDVPVPPTATDMTTYVAQALAGKPQAISTIVGPAQASAIFKQVRAQGAKIPLITGSNVMTPSTIASLGKNVTNNMIITGWALNPTSPSDRGKPAVKQYLSELKAAEAARRPP